MEEPNKFSLSDDQIEKLCTLADEAARKYVTSKISKNEISDLTISVDLEETKGLKVEVVVDLMLSESFTEADVKNLADEAVKSAFKVIDEYMKEVSCQSRT